MIGLRIFAGLMVSAICAKFGPVVAHSSPLVFTLTLPTAFAAPDILNQSGKLLLVKTCEVASLKVTVISATDEPLPVVPKMYTVLADW